MAARHVPLLLICLSLAPLGACQCGPPRQRGEQVADTAPSPPAVLPPHPEYPTAAMAGTEELFLLEEPPRGPHVTNVELPDRTRLRTTEHAGCEVGPVRLACSSSRPRPGTARWNVGRAGERVVLAEHVTPGGRVDETYLFDWDESGRLARLVALDENGGVEWTRSFNPAGERYMERTLNGANALSGCGAMSVRADGPTRLELGCLQWNGSPMRDTNGVSLTAVRLDGNGFILERSRLTRERKPVAGHDGVHRIVYQRDPHGRVLAELYLGLDGKPALSLSAGCAGRRHELDERGVVIRETCLGRTGGPASAEEGVAVTEHETNADGCVIGSRRLDAEGKPTHVRGVYALRIEPDASCRELTTTCVGVEGEPVPCGPGQPARTDYERDAKGRVVSVKHRGPDGDPGQDPEYGVFELRRTWDALDNLVEESCWGASGEAVECDHTGYHTERIVVDEAGRTREVRYFDAQGLAATNLGVAVRRYIYDNYDHLREIHGFGEDGDVASSLGMSVQRRLYDPGHRLFALLLFDRSGQPARYAGCFTGRDCPPREWHAVRIYRGANGRVIKNAYFDADGQHLDTLDCDTHRCW